MDIDPSPGIDLVFSDAIGCLLQRPDSECLKSSFVLDVMAQTDRGTLPYSPLGLPLSSWIKNQYAGAPWRSRHPFGSSVLADFVRLGEEGMFHADPAADSVLTMSSPTAFGFRRQNPAAISIQGSSLEVDEGKTLSMVGGGHQDSGSWYFGGPDACSAKRPN